MVDNRPDTRVSMRTPLARVEGLGAAGSLSSRRGSRLRASQASRPATVASQGPSRERLRTAGRLFQSSTQTSWQTSACSSDGRW